MILNLGLKRFTDSHLKSGNFNEYKFSEIQNHTLSIIKDWYDGKERFKINTSGSTGIPKTIELDRTILTYSAKTSIEYLDPTGAFQNSLLCINPKYIGGLMVIIRSLIYDYELTVVEPSNTPLADLNNTFDLTSMVPTQIQTLLNESPEKIENLACVLIGGAPLGQHCIEKLQKYKTRSYQTYGMTETASHIALKDLNKEDDNYITLGDLTIGVDSRDCLNVKGTVTSNQLLQTNDVVELLGRDSFRWKGRHDFVINSGGYKVQTQELEEKLSQMIPQPYFLAGIPDEKWGEKVVLLIEGMSNVSLFYNGWHQYEIPKEVIYLDRFIYTTSGKIDRKNTIKSLKT